MILQKHVLSFKCNDFFKMANLKAISSSATLTHLPPVSHICRNELGQHWFRQWLAPCSAPGHYLNQCWLVINWIFRNKLRWNSGQNKNKNFSFMKMRFKMSSANWRPFCLGGDELTHDDVIKWNFPRYWPFVRGIHRSPVNSPHKGQWRGALMFSLICARINGWVNNGEAGDLRRHRVHYDIIVMISHMIYSNAFLERDVGYFDSNFIEVCS